MPAPRLAGTECVTALPCTVGVSAKPELREVEIDPGAEWLVIASDGIFDVLEDAEVTQILVRACGPLDPPNLHGKF